MEFGETLPTDVGSVFDRGQDTASGTYVTSKGSLECGICVHRPDPRRARDQFPVATTSVTPGTRSLRIRSMPAVTVLSGNRTAAARSDEFEIDRSAIDTGQHHVPSIGQQCRTGCSRASESSSSRSMSVSPFFGRSVGDAIWMMLPSTFVIVLLVDRMVPIRGVKIATST